MKKSQLISAIKTVLAEGMPNFKKPTKFETQNDTPEMAKVRKKLHPIQDRWDQFEKDVKANKFSPEKKKELRDKILDDQQAVFAELNKLAKEAKDKKKDEKKQKLSESTIREIIREVLSEEGQDITVSLSPAEVSAILDALANSNIENNVSKAGDMQGAGGRILANLAQATAKLKNAYYPNPQADLNEEAYDTVRDVTQALNTSRPSQDAVEDYLGRSLSSDELRAFGFNSGIVTGYKYGQPQYAGQGQKKTYTRYARSNSRRSY